MIAIRNAKEIELIRQSGRILAGALRIAESRIAAGMVTGDLDAEIAAYIRAQGAKAAFKGYNGYPANTCISIDEQVVHGIPGKRVLKEGEIVSVDVGVLWNGYYSDAARTFKVGVVGPEKERLMQVTLESLSWVSPPQPKATGSPTSDMPSRAMWRPRDFRWCATW